jgi:hypothetical protein
MNGVRTTPGTAGDVDRPPAPAPAPGLARILDPEIVPFEVWDLMVDSSLWAERFYEPGFSLALRNGIETLREGRGMTRSNGPVPKCVTGFEAIFLSGGRSGEQRTCAELDGIAATIAVAKEGVFGGVVGGVHWLRSRGLSGWVLDLGQSQLKLATPDRQWTFPRDSTRLRAAGEVSSFEIPVQRRRLREFVALKLQLALTESQRRPEALVFALPTRLAADGTPLGGNYAGLRGYREMIPETLELAGLSDVPSFVLNDAELAAFSARADPRLAQFRKILVLTLGFGIGAALVCRSN